MRRLRITVEYDGADFAGWQLQPDVRTVQGVLEVALAQVTGQAVRVIGAGRTDAGVHARGQVAHLDTASRLPDPDLQRALNAVLDADVAILELRRVPDAFNARGDALLKRYVYRILTRRASSPLRRRRVWQLREPLDLDAMALAAGTLEGTHDFSAFRGARGGSPAQENALRSLDRLSLEKGGDEIRLVAEGRSFLRYMVRNVVGTLVEVGAGRLSAEAVAEILASRDRSRAGPTAPAHGLCLEWIRYAGDPA